VINYSKISNWEKNDFGTYSYKGSNDMLPSAYSGKNILEDMSESAMLYFCDPDKLIKISPERYNYLKENLFDGKEYFEER